MNGATYNTSFIPNKFPTSLLLEDHIKLIRHLMTSDLTMIKLDKVVLDVICNL